MKKETISATEILADTQTRRTSNTATNQRTQDMSSAFDLEGLMTDFPTAGELQKFLFDQTGLVLNLKGRSNKYKYQVALDVLKGLPPPAELLGGENPYLDKNDIVPTDPMKTLPPQPAEVFGHIPVIQFQCNTFPHPDPQWSATGQKCQVVFRKYINNIITYEILGPIAQRAVGTRINKFGQNVPDKYIWVDPRQGEQIIQYGNGTITAIGTRLRNFMSKMKVGNKTQWETWIDRDFVIGGNAALALDNPWGA